MELNKKIAEGNTAEIYDYEEGKILKLFRTFIPYETVQFEFQKGEFISKYVSNVPKVYEIIPVDDRYGIVYEKLIGTDLLQIMIKSNTKIKKYAKEMAALHFNLHQTEVAKEDQKFRLKDNLEYQINTVNDLSDSEKKIVREYLKTLPEKNKLCHFDFHPGNIYMTEQGPYIIDWMTGCVGDPYADVARTTLLLSIGSLPHASFFERTTVTLFKRYINKIYLKEYVRLSGINKAGIDAWILPIAAARLAESPGEKEKKQLLDIIHKKIALLSK